MNKFVAFLFLSIVLASCNNENKPDVSAVKVDATLVRFEQDFFALDTNNVSNSLQQLHNKYPYFLQDYIYNILGLPAQPDSLMAIENGVRSFISSYKQLKEEADREFDDLPAIAKQVEEGLKYVKHYFPRYPLPAKVLTFIGPFDSYGSILTTEAFAVGLQMYMGHNFSWYQSEEGQQLYPTYISRRFEKAYIPVNCIRNIVDDMYPDNSAGKPLIEQMIEAGKRLYLVDRFLPDVADTLKTGYTEKQLEGCRENEPMIWAFFLQNDLLYVTDPAITKDYMNDGPKTTALGEASPGFIGQFVGWQIIKKYVEKQENVSLRQLMETDAKSIFQQSKYKPK